jgi:hypothetical protein
MSYQAIVCVKNQTEINPFPRIALRDQLFSTKVCQTAVCLFTIQK